MLFFEIGTAGSLEIESTNGFKITLDGKKESASSALINSSGNLTLTNCNLQNNKNTASFGGAICINDGNATLTNCIVGSEVNDSGETERWRNAASQDNYSNYSAKGGGGIYIAEGIVAINNSKISFNYTPNPDQNYGGNTPSGCTHGGGINIVKGSLSLTSSEGSYNSGYQGGGIRCYSESSSAGTFTINDSNIKGNASRAYRCHDFGGAIMIKNFDFECGDITSTVEENYSGDGGAIFFEYSTPTLQNIIIQNNAYNEEGYCNGADVLLYAGSNVSISSETVQILNKETETKGVYISKSNNNLNLSSSAHISTPIYLESGAKINVDGALTSASGTIVAKITLNDECTSGTQILTTTTGIELAEIVGYFDLTNDNYILTEEGKIEVVTLISKTTNLDKFYDATNECYSVSTGNYAFTQNIELAAPIYIQNGESVSMWASNDAKITASFEDDNMIYIAPSNSVDDVTSSLTLGRKNSAQLILSYSSNTYSTIQIEGKLILKDNCQITDSKYCAIYVKQGDFEMQGGSIHDNTYEGNNIQSSAITFANPTADNYIYGGFSGGKIYNNSTKTNGGAIAIMAIDGDEYNSSCVYVNNIEICDNKASGKGGGIYTKFSGLYIKNDGAVKIYRNTASEGKSIYAEDSVVYFIGDILQNQGAYDNDI